MTTINENSLEVYFNKKENFTKNAIKIYDEMTYGQEYTNELLSELTGLPITSVRPRTNELQTKGVIKKIRNTKNISNNSTSVFVKCKLTEFRAPFKVELKTLLNKLNKLSSDELDLVLDKVMELKRNG